MTALLAGDARIDSAGSTITAGWQSAGSWASSVARKVSEAAAPALSEASSACKSLFARTVSTVDSLRSATSGVALDAARAVLELTGDAEVGSNAARSAARKQPQGRDTWTAQRSGSRRTSGGPRASGVVDVSARAVLGEWRRATKEWHDAELFARSAPYAAEDDAHCSTDTDTDLDTLTCEDWESWEDERLAAQDHSGSSNRTPVQLARPLLPGISKAAAVDVVVKRLLALDANDLDDVIVRFSKKRQ